MTRPRICQHEGCDRPLIKTNRSSVCGLHRHSYACTCTECSKRVRPNLGHVVEDDSKRVVQVVRISTTPGAKTRVPVSVRREPWA